MTEKELLNHIKWLEYQVSITHSSDHETRGQLFIAINCAKEQLEKW